MTNPPAASAPVLGLVRPSAPVIAACAVLRALGGAIGSIDTNIVGQRIIAALRKALAARILAAPIAALERYRSHRLIPVLTHDVDMISNFAFVLSTFGVSLTVTFNVPHKRASLVMLQRERFCGARLWQPAPVRDGSPAEAAG